MIGKDLKEIVNSLPDNAEVVISKTFLIDKKDEVVAVLDTPVLGVSVNDNMESNEQEIRFILSSDDVKSGFSPDDITFLGAPFKIIK